MLGNSLDRPTDGRRVISLQMTADSILAGGTLRWPAGHIHDNFANWLRAYCNPGVSRTIMYNTTYFQFHVKQLAWTPWIFCSISICLTIGQHHCLFAPTSLHESDRHIPGTDQDMPAGRPHTSCEIISVRFTPNDGTSLAARTIRGRCERERERTLCLSGTQPVGYDAS